MELLLNLLSNLPGALNTVLSIGQWVRQQIRSDLSARPNRQVHLLLQELGCVTEEHLARLVRQNVPEDMGEAEIAELIELLTNLVRGVRFHTTHGTAMSVYTRMERFIEQLLANLQPLRKAGEQVGPGWGDWRLERFLGMGSFGEVWVGHNPRFHHRRAFKFFTREGAAEWLTREADALCRVAAQLNRQDNIVGYENIVRDGTPHPFLVLEYVDGGSLEDWILTPKSCPSPETDDLMRAVARGLSTAHRAGVVHRDLKPANVLMTAIDRVPKIADFGLSRVDSTTPTDSPSSTQSLLVGTSMYLPPEAADPYEARQHEQDDVFAFGVMWYQCLVGQIVRPPYDFVDRLTTLGIDSRTIRLLSRCLASPDRRFADAMALLAVLDDDVAPIEWAIPEGCFDIGPLARESIHTLAG